jgi:hypothetical protein
MREPTSPSARATAPAQSLGFAAALVASPLLDVSVSAPRVFEESAFGELDPHAARSSGAKQSVAANGAMRAARLIRGD